MWETETDQPQRHQNWSFHLDPIILLIQVLCWKTDNRKIVTKQAYNPINFHSVKSKKLKPFSKLPPLAGDYRLKTSI